MQEPELVVERVWKKFHKGQLHDSLRDRGRCLPASEHFDHGFHAVVTAGSEPGQVGLADLAGREQLDQFMLIGLVVEVRDLAGGLVDFAFGRLFSRRIRAVDVWGRRIVLGWVLEALTSLGERFDLIFAVRRHNDPDLFVVSSNV